MTRFAAVLLACAAFSACKGGEGEDCNSAGVLGPLYCDDGLICNEAAGIVCEKPMSRGENQPCSQNDLCATGLWCDNAQMKCRLFLNPGDSCSNPFSCGPNAGCTRDLATMTTICKELPDGGAGDAATDGAPTR